MSPTTTACADSSLRRPNRRRPFRHQTRSPRVRTRPFTARPPDLRRRALVVRASRISARSPCSTMPRIRFLFIGPQLRSPLPSRRPHGSTLCGSLPSLRPACERTYTSKVAPMPGALKKAPRMRSFDTSLWWSRRGSNPRPLECGSSALPAELLPRAGARFLPTDRLCCQAHCSRDLQPVTQASSATSSPLRSASKWRKIVRGSTPSSRAVFVRLPPFRSSASSM